MISINQLVSAGEMERTIRTTDVTQPDVALVVRDQRYEAELEPIRALGLNDACCNRSSRSNNSSSL
jgi:hypothetical protein